MSWGRKKSSSAQRSCAEPLCLALALALAGPSCKQEDVPAPSTAVPAAPAPNAAPGPVISTPTAAPGGVPAPGTPATTGVAPAFGLFCASDNDAQCPFGRCVGGRCGGCSSVAECKPGTQCLPTLVGQLCLPGAAAPTPTPSGGAATAALPTPGTAPAPGATGAQNVFERARQLCVQRTSEYRARVGVGPVTRRSDAEPCGDAQAKADSVSRTAHSAFGQCRERAQNECPGWPGAAEDVVDRCLAMMFAEGPGEGPAHGHYVNMTDPRYRGVSCGFSQTENGELWVVQDFYP